MKRSTTFILAVILSLALMYFSYLPAVGILGHVLVLFSTLAHEMGHGIMAILVGGEFQELVINWDTSGETAFAARDGRIVQALVAAGGLIGPSVVAALIFYSARKSDQTFFLTTRLFGIILVVAGLATARSLWAIILSVGLGGLLLVISAKLNRKTMEALVVFIGVQLGLSVFTRADYLFTRWAGHERPSDVAQMSEALFLPFWFWGAVCGLFSVAVLLWGCRCYIKE